jgi:hypothetical protein
MKPIIKALAAASACTALLIPPQAAAQQITWSVNGIIDHGRDDLNLFFGSPGEVVFLGGQTYTMSLTLDAADFDQVDRTSTTASYAGTAIALTGTLTMNGKTFTWTTPAASSSARLERPDGPPPNDRHVLSLRTDAARQPGTGNKTVMAWNEVYAFSWPLLASTDLDQEVSFPEFMRSTTAWTHFSATGMGAVPDLTTWFDGRITSASWTVSAVPEPGQVGMLAAGLLGVALVRRRRGRMALEVQPVVPRAA